MSSKKHDPVNFPSHYNKGDIGCIDAIKSCQGDGFKYYLQGSAIKYVWRHEHKGKPIEDLDKAIWFLNKLKEEYKWEPYSNHSSHQKQNGFHLIIYQIYLVMQKLQLT